jgi:hypothetical protein
VNTRNSADAAVLLAIASVPESTRAHTVPAASSSVCAQCSPLGAALRPEPGYSRRLLLRTAMKEGLPGGTLSVSPESEVEEAHAHVARWIGSQS